MAELTLAAIEAEVSKSAFVNEAAGLCRGIAPATLKHGDWPRWACALDQLPKHGLQVALGADAPHMAFDADVDSAALREILMQLHPWRKGPWQFADVVIDSEWRSDLKWRRLMAAGVDFADKRVLDIGGGNGYFICKMTGAGAAAALNVDPTLLFYAQFLAFTQHANLPTAAMLPMPFEMLPDTMPFDVVLSMGVLYHRRDPIAHLKSIRSRLAQHGQLVLETLIVEGDDTTAFVPPGRYARMRNVWFLPSVAALTRWLQRSGFDDVICHDVTATTPDEQRSTDWMTFESLAEALAPDDPTRTIEGHPGPKRALLTATVR